MLHGQRLELVVQPHWMDCEGTEPLGAAAVNRERLDLIEANQAAEFRKDSDPRTLLGSPG